MRNMKDMMKFMIQAMFSLLIMAVGLGVIFCFITGSIDHFVPFMKVGSIIIMMDCLGVMLLDRA